MATLSKIPAAMLASLLAMPAFAAVEGISDSEIRLGMVNVQSGPAAALGKGMREGALAMFKDVNAKGGVHGRQILLVVADDGYEPDKAVDETLKMIEQQKVFSLFGGGLHRCHVAAPAGDQADVQCAGQLRR